MSKPFFEIKYQDLQDRAKELIGRQLTSNEVENSKWILFDLSSDMLDKLIENTVNKVIKDNVK